MLALQKRRAKRYGLSGSKSLGQKGTLMSRQRNRIRQGRILRGLSSAATYTQRLSQGGEVKGMDTTLATPGFLTISEATNVSTGVGVLNLIAPGSGSWNRIGRKTFPKSLRLKYTVEYTFQHTATNSVQANCLRILLVWDKNPNGAALPSFNTMFKQTDQFGAELSTWSAPAAFDTMDRFRVIRDRVIDLNPQIYPPASTNEGQWHQNVDEFIVLPEGLETVYSGQADPQTIADIYSGALYMVAILQKSLSSGYAVRLSAGSVARLRYTD